MVSSSEASQHGALVHWLSVHLCGSVCRTCSEKGSAEESRFDDDGRDEDFIYLFTETVFIYFWERPTDIRVGRGGEESVSVQRSREVLRTLLFRSAHTRGAPKPLGKKGP